MMNTVTRLDYRDIVHTKIMTMNYIIRLLQEDRHIGILLVAPAVRRPWSCRAWIPSTEVLRRALTPRIVMALRQSTIPLRGMVVVALDIASVGLK